MSDTGKSGTKRPAARAPAKKPPPRWRRYLVQAELELPPPCGDDRFDGPAADDATDAATPMRWWQARIAVGGLAVACALLLIITGTALLGARRDRQAAATAAASVRSLTLRATTTSRVLRIVPNPRSWSASPDATLAWLEPPELLEVHLPVGYADYPNFAVTIDKVDHGRILVVHRIAPDSNGDLRLALNSSALGRGEYRIRLQGYTWRGERRDAGWARLHVR